MATNVSVEALRKIHDPYDLHGFPSFLVYRGREQRGKVRESGDKGTGSGRQRYGKREKRVREAGEKGTGSGRFLAPGSPQNASEVK